jgi:hypothetical protein
MKHLLRNLKIKRRLLNQHTKTYGGKVGLTKCEVARHKYTAEQESRVEYYLGDIAHKKVEISAATIAKAQSNPQDPFLANYENTLQAGVAQQTPWSYVIPVYNVLNLLSAEYKKKSFLWLPWDNPEKSNFEGVLGQARLKDDFAITICKFLLVRYWGLIKNLAERDVPYRDKKGQAVWRGATTGNDSGNGTRYLLVNKLYRETKGFDVGFSQIVQNQDHLSHLLKASKTIEEQLKHKFLICMAGNDVASGLMWMLSSNSVVLMPKPEFESWLMEDKLQPYVHYIPLAEDLSDIEQQLEWCKIHEAECIKISDNATQYMQQFLDPRQEVLIECEVMRRYLDNLTVC